jgi:hypothetical protein
MRQRLSARTVGRPTTRPAAGTRCVRHLFPQRPAKCRGQLQRRLCRERRERDRAGRIRPLHGDSRCAIIGVPAGQNILGVSNVLNYPDILASAATQFVDGWIEINVSQDSGVAWGGWQKFVPGVFPGNAWNFRLGLESVAANIIPFATAFSYAVQLPARIDHYQALAVPAGGLSVTFKLDGTTTPAPFNGGPGTSSIPYYSVSWQATAGDTYTVTGLSLAALTIQFFNGGVPVARSGVNIDVEGF